MRVVKTNCPDILTRSCTQLVKQVILHDKQSFISVSTKSHSREPNFSILPNFINYIHFILPYILRNLELSRHLMYPDYEVNFLCKTQYLYV
jgi:hypothetical protein